MNGLEASNWMDKLNTRVIGRGENRVLQEIDSTNTEAKRMARSGAPSGSLCLAEHQSAGRGRLGRSWNSPAGQGLWLSVLLRPEIGAEQIPLLTFCTAMAMADAIRQTTPLQAMLKWPNDVICDGKKVCGILLETVMAQGRIDAVVIGTGLNVHPGAYPPELKGQAAALAELCSPPSRAEILAAYLNALEARTEHLARQGFAGISEDYRAMCCTLGSRVHVSGAVELTGVAEDIDAAGALYVRTEDGDVHRVLAGDVSVRGVMGYV